MYDCAQNPVQSINTLCEYGGKSVNDEQVFKLTRQTSNLKEYLVERWECAADLWVFGNEMEIILKKGENSDPHITVNVTTKLLPNFCTVINLRILKTSMEDNKSSNNRAGECTLCFVGEMQG